MRAVIQRVDTAEVRVDGKITGSIGKGLLILLGVTLADTARDVETLSRKIISLRIFDDPQGIMNLSVQDVTGSLLVVSQFTLYGDCKKGRRPDYAQAAPAAQARTLYSLFVDTLAAYSVPVEQGEFGSHMSVSLTNNGPVTLIIDTAQ